MSGPTTYLRMPVTTGLEPYSGPWTANEAAHLIKRTLFGATRADIEHFLGMSPAQAVNALLSIDPTPLAPPLKDPSVSRHAAPRGILLSGGQTHG